MLFAISTKLNNPVIRWIWIILTNILGAATLYSMEIRRDKITLIVLETIGFVIIGYVIGFRIGSIIFKNRKKRFCDDDVLHGWEQPDAEET